MREPLARRARVRHRQLARARARRVDPVVTRDALQVAEREQAGGGARRAAAPPTADELSAHDGDKRRAAEHQAAEEQQCRLRLRRGVVEAEGAAAARARRRLLAPHRGEPRVRTAGGGRRLRRRRLLLNFDRLRERAAARRRARAEARAERARAGRRRVARRRRALGRRVPAESVDHPAGARAVARCEKWQPAHVLPVDRLLEGGRALDGSQRRLVAHERRVGARLRARLPVAGAAPRDRVSRRRRRLSERQVAAGFARRRPLVAGAQPVEGAGVGVALLHEGAEDEAAGVRLGRRAEEEPLHKRLGRRRAVHESLAAAARIRRRPEARRDLERDLPAANLLLPCVALAHGVEQQPNVLGRLERRVAPALVHHAEDLPLGDGEGKRDELARDIGGAAGFDRQHVDLRAHRRRHLVHAVRAL